MDSELWRTVQSVGEGLNVNKQTHFLCPRRFGRPWGKPRRSWSHTAPGTLLRPFRSGCSWRTRWRCSTTTSRSKMPRSSCWWPRRGWGLLSCGPPLPSPLLPALFFLNPPFFSALPCPPPPLFEWRDALTVSSVSFSNVHFLIFGGGTEYWGTPSCLLGTIKQVGVGRGQASSAFQAAMGTEDPPDTGTLYFSVSSSPPPSSPCLTSLFSFPLSLPFPCEI